MGALAILAPFLGKILGFLAVLGGAVALYFGIKHKGVVEERDRQVEIQREAQAKVEKKVVEAESKDKEIDDRVKQKLEEIKKIHLPSKSSSDDIFRF